MNENRPPSHSDPDRPVEEQDGARPPMPMGKVAFASLIGSVVEWYDFFLYGTAAALVFNKLFFPQLTPVVGTIAAFSTYAIGFIARPLGGVIFGHFGDKIGRKSVLTTTLVMMGIATTAIGLLPTFAQVGIWAPLALVLLRVVQGIGVGGEWGGAVLLTTEYAPPGKRGFYGSWPQAGVPLGSLLGAAAFAVVSGILTPEQFLAWGWRIPFVLSVVLIGVGMYIRLRIEETPAFSKVHESHTEARKPILDVLRYYWKNVLIAMAARLGENALYYIYTVFILSYGTQAAGIARGTLLNAILVASALEAAMIPAFGALSDKVGRRPVYLAGALFGAVAAFPLFWFVDTGSGVMATIGISLTAVGHAAMYGPQAAFFSELFGTRVRYSGASLGYQLSSVLAGGLSPVIAALLLAEFGSGTPVAIYLAVLCLITTLGVWLAVETRTVSLTAVQPEENRLLSHERGAPAV